ncbi:MAG: hypothetical protein HYV63_06330, partial [Candidatus Schekmanbacteria bacterium]|nr:hypothetical protein [Candidatus Schekmanbacteria bacterium]
MQDVEAVEERAKARDELVKHRPRDPVCMLRGIVLMAMLGLTSFNEWAAMFKGRPELVAALMAPIAGSDLPVHIAIAGANAPDVLSGVDAMERCETLRRNL